MRMSRQKVYSSLQPGWTRFCKSSLERLKLVTKTLSYEHALNAIRLMYQRVGFRVDNHTLGQQVYREFGHDVANSKLGALYAFVDEHLALLRMVSWYFISAMTADKKQPNAVVFYKVTVTHLRALAALRMLCSSGLDSNARLQVRFLYENAVLWTRLRIDPTALADYQQAISPDQSNKFWHSYLAKSKSEKFLKAELALRGQSWLGTWDDAVGELQLKVGPAAHPSFFSDGFNAAQDWAEDDGLILGGPNDASHFSLSKGLFAAAMPFSIKPEPLYELATTDFIKVGHPFNCIPHDTESWPEYSRLISDMIPSLYVMAVRFIEGLRN